MTHKWYLSVYPDNKISACFTCDPISYLHCETCDNIGDIWQDEIEKRLDKYTDLQVRLTATEQALAAAGEYIKGLEPYAIDAAGKEIFESYWGLRDEKQAYLAALAKLAESYS